MRALQVNRVIIAPSTLQVFLEHLKPEQCREDGLTVSSNEITTALMIHGKPLNTDSLYTVMDNLRKAGWFDYIDYTERPGHFYIQNGLGIKWRSFLEGYLKGFIEALGAESEITVVGDNLLLRIVENEE
jgi:hypothetical protein